uniref:Protein EARLY FLOWERING 4 domain-containing protein n=1 Tax=Ananas comosus var. bracteatus TaxID=296719 RepID=A0A6V7QIH8_ANACO|nr:unnamed protein product [Ananas comosus var. bracteatus]
MDFGYPRNLWPEILKLYITQEGVRKARARTFASLLKKSKNIRFASPFGTRQPIEIEKFRAAYVLFCAAKLRKGRGRKRRKRKGFDCARLDDFFKEAQQFSLKFDQILSKFYGSDWEQKLEVHYKVNHSYSSLILHNSYRVVVQSEQLVERSCVMSDILYPAVVTDPSVREAVGELLDQNRLLINEINQNHESRIPDNLSRNVGLIRELNSNIRMVVDLYADLSTSLGRSVAASSEGDSTGTLKSGCKAG